MSKTKKCIGCSEIKSIYEFDVYYRDCHEYIKSRCRECMYKTARLVKLKIRYGIDPDSYFKMVESQQGKCKICNRKVKLTIDHCHKTGKVRGLLCSKCNNGVGGMKDNKEIMYKAIKYLNYHKKTNV